MIMGARGTENSISEVVETCSIPQSMVLGLYGTSELRHYDSL